MEVKLWEGGLQSQEIKAIEIIQKTFSPDPVSGKSRPKAGGSLQDQMRGLGLKGMFPWKGYAGFRFVDAKGNEGEFDLVIVTHCNVLIVELKDWNQGEVKSRGDRWYKNDVDMGRSPVSVTQKKVHLLKNKLERFKHRFSNSGWTPFVHHFVVMTGNAGFSKITDQERIHTLSLKEFLSLADEGNFNKKFVKVHSNAKVLNQDFDIFDELFLGNNTAPKQIRVDGYRATDLIFEHPQKVYKEFQAVSEISKGDEALLRLWNFENLSGSKAKTADGRFAIVSREREVLQFIKHQDHDLYKHCLRSLTSVQKDEVTTEYSEVYELPPNHLRFNEFIAKHGPSFSDIDKSNLMKLLVAKFADLHQIKVAHRDLGDHSIWISPSKEVALSNFISAYHKPAGTVGDYRQFLAVNEILDGADLEGVRTPFEADVRALGLLSWHILNAKRISPKSIAEIKEEAVTSTSFYGPVLLSALTGGHFADATELFDALKDAEPKDGEILSFDQAELDPYRKTINHSRQFREDDDFLVETEEREVYLSNGLIVKAWLNVAGADDASSGYKLLHFLRRVEKLQAASPHYIPCIREFGIATKSASLYVVMDNAEGFHWNELSLEESDKFAFIKRLIDSVEHLHGMNIAHGDLHPGNVIAGREDGDYALYLIDIPDYSADSEETFNHRYSPENIDSCTAYERDNYAVMRMACELLGIEWEESSEDYKYITDAVAEELEDTLFGFKDLARFKSAIQTPESELAQPVNISLKGSFEAITIYPDNGHLYVQIEPSNRDPSDARVRMLGIGGSVDLIFKVKDRAFVVGFAPRARSSVRRDDTEKSQLELDFPIRIEPSSGYDLSELSKKLESSEAFARAIELALQKEDSKEVAVVESAMDSNEIAPEAIEEFGTRTEPELRISTENLWKAILETETESYPYIEVYDGPRPVKDNKDQLIIPYQADVDALGQFRKTDVIEALILDKDKEISIGEVLLKQSALNEIRLSKLRFKAKNLSEGDVIFFRTKQDRASYEKRKAALQCLLDREGLITNLVTYFDPSCALPAQTYDVDVTEEDFSRYDRTDDQGNLISLNQQQRGAFQKLIQNGPLSLLQGPPGTGKTEFIAAFVHYLIEKQQVQRVLLVSQSHEAVNTAAERIRNHCARLETSLDVVRFSNREGAVSSGLKDVYSNSIISEKRELFRAEAKHRASSLGRALGLEPGYLSALVNVELKLFRQIDHSTSLMDSLASQKLEAEDAKELKKSLKELNETIRISMHEEFGIVLAPEDGVDVAKKRVIEKLNHDYAVRPDEALRARALAKISRDMLNVLETEEVNYDEFLARSRQLVTGTCVGIGQRHIGIRENQYDWVIIDEAARSISSELAIAMQAGKRVLLVGDHKQLPPLYTIPHKQALARRLGISASASDLDVMLQSDFARAFESKFGDQVGATLLTQYRMGPQIGDLVSEVFYDGKLGNGNRAIPDIYDPLPTALQAPVTWLDTSSLGPKAHHQSDKGVSIYNRSEADLIIKLLKEVAENLDLLLDLKSSVKDGEPAIGVICMYGEQKRILRQKFKEVQWDDDFKALVKIDTVDSYQGKENRIIILSLTRSDKHQSPGFLKAPNRINVALSRAMDRLLIVGSLQMWQSKNKELPLGRVASFMEEKGASGGYRFVNAKSGKEQGGQVQ